MMDSAGLAFGKYSYGPNKASKQASHMADGGCLHQLIKPRKNTIEKVSRQTQVQNQLEL